MAELGQEMWHKRYHETSMTLTRLTTRSSAFLQKGQAISLIHVALPVNSGENRVDVKMSDHSLTIQFKNRVYEFPAASFSLYHENSSAAIAYPSIHFQKWVSFDQEVTGIYTVDEHSFVCTLENNHLVLIKDQKIMWTKSMPSAVHCLTFTPENGGMLLMGCGKNQLLTLNIHGDVLWKTEIEGIPTMFVSWEKPHPEVVAINCKMIDGHLIIAAGCGDDHIRLYDSTGNLLTAFYVYATVPDILEFADLFGNGKLSILAAGREASSQGVFYVYDIHGKEGQHIYTGKWLCNITSYSMRYEKTKLIITCGMKYSENLKIIQVENGSYQTICEKMLGGTVTSLCENQNSIYAGTSKGFIISLTHTGDVLWYLDVKTPIFKLFSMNDAIIILCENGTILSVSHQGKIQKTNHFSSPISGCIKFNDHLIISSGKNVFIN